MSTLHIRRAREGDLTEIVNLLADDMLGKLRETDPGDPVYAEAFSAIDRDPNQFLAVAEVDGGIAGCLQLSFIPGLSRKGMWRGQIESVRIAAAHRGKGLGRQMIGWAVGECRRRGCGIVQLTSDRQRTDAIRFYESLGFEYSHAGLKIDL